MLDQGRTPNAVNSNATVDARAKTVDFEGAKLWHNRMVETGIEIWRCFGSMISALAEAGDADKAEIWLNHVADLVEPHGRTRHRARRYLS